MYMLYKNTIIEHREYIYIYIYTYVYVYIGIYIYIHSYYTCCLLSTALLLATEFKLASKSCHISKICCGVLTQGALEDERCLKWYNKSWKLTLANLRKIMSTDFKCLVPGTWCQVLSKKYLLPSTWCQVLAAKCLVPGTWWQVLGTKYLVPDI